MASLRYERFRSTCVSALICLLTCSILSSHVQAASSESDQQATQSVPTQKSLLLNMQDAFTRIAATAEPFVVNIKAQHPIEPTRTPKDAPLGTPPGNGNGPDAAPDSSPFPRESEAAGSGAIVSPDGYILTNEHVVEGADYVIVTFNDGREFVGKVSSDRASDLAIVKVDPGKVKLPTCTFADSDKVTPGQWAIAIGSPFDLQNTMTLGIISAVHRHTVIGDNKIDARYYPDLIQTDAAINPGNSGGPLINIDGEVVGINVAIESPVDVSSGVGFAIPSNIAKRIMNNLIKYGKVSRGFLGLAPADLTPALQTEFGVSTGAWVLQVDKDSPAGRAGVHAADTIQSFAGKPITDEISLRLAIADTQPGTQVPMTVVRDGKSISFSIVVGSPPPAPETIKENKSAQSPVQKKIGISVRTITAGDRNELNLDPSAAGAYIVAVQPNSPAERAGMRPGDVITRVGKTPVDTADDAAKALAGLEPRSQTTIIITRVDSNKVEELAIDLRTWE